MRQILIIALAALTLLSGAARGQYSDYDWAMALHREFGFDDLAEKILSSMVEGEGRTPLERQQGKLGLAELKAALARRSRNAAERLKLFEEARKLMGDVVKTWPDKSSTEYYEAIFRLVDVLLERGETAQEALTSGSVPAEKAAEWRKAAEDAYTRAEVYLDKVRSRFEKADPEKDRTGWRLKNRAWYLQCLMAYNRAMILKPGSVKQGMILSDASEKLEEYILANEIDDSEAMLGALYGYLLMGQVAEARGDKKEAESQWRSVLDQIVWETKLPPSIQALVEKTYWRLLQFHNREGNYEKTVELGTEMEGHFKDVDMRFGLLGRAALVELAKAYFKLGDTNQALRLVAEVAQTGRADASGVLANRLVAEIIAAEPDKTRFDPSIIEAAAKGAWSQGGENRKEAVSYYKILLQVIDQIPDEKERAKVEAEAWYRLASHAYNKDQLLKAALICRAGAKRCSSVPETGPRLVSYWERWLKSFEQSTGSKEVRRLISECRRWQLDNAGRISRSGAITKTKGDLLYEQARDKEAEAKQASSRKDYARAIALYREAAELYRRASRQGGRNQERALVKQARCGLKEAKLLFRQGKEKDAIPLLERAKKEFRNYLAYTKDPANQVTDPTAVAARKTAAAEATYSIADANGYLLRAVRDAGKQKAIHQEIVRDLAGFEKEFADQKALVMFGLRARFKSQLALNDSAAALETYRAMKAVDPDHSFTSWAGATIAKTMRRPLFKRLTAIVGKTDPSDESRWRKLTEGNQDFARLREELMRSNDLFREYLLSSQTAQKDFKNWYVISGYYWQIGAWEPAAMLMKKALEKFDGTAAADPKSLRFLKYKLLVAAVNLAREAERKQDKETAQRWWADAARLSDEILAFKKKIRYDQVLRLAAIAHGGYVEKRRGGVFVRVLANGNFERATELWRQIHKRAEAGSDSWWEAYFNLLYSAWQKARKTGASTTRVKKSLKALRASTQGDFGGPQWRPYFEWLERQIS